MKQLQTYKIIGRWITLSFCLSPSQVLLVRWFSASLLLRVSLLKVDLIGPFAVQVPAVKTLEL